MTNNLVTSDLALPTNLTLGQTVDYEDSYNPALLQGVPRSLSRDTLSLADELPFDGIDIWNGYEVSWLNAKGKPQVAILRCYVPITSTNLVESKSFKLYLNSFNQTRFDDWAEVTRIMQSDLSKCAKAQVEVKLLALNRITGHAIGSLEGTNIDDIDVEIDHYQPDSGLLKTTDEEVTETLCSDLLKSNCLITSQPDWASVMIKYQGRKIDHASLLKYLISFRQHNEFHEQCVERLFCDILSTCKPNKLTVYARYTRRGGLDINPFRSNFEKAYDDLRLARQ